MNAPPWNPHNLVDCVDSIALGYTTAVLAFGMLVWYIMIAWRWYESMQHASRSGRIVWGSLMLIFIVCAMAGYVSLILSLWLPKVSVVWRITFLALQNAVCPIFWVAARKHKFHLQGAYQSAGEYVVTSGLVDMDDKKLASEVRVMVAEFTRRATVNQ